MHSEVPIGTENLRAFQIWFNLAAKDKMVEPKYQTLRSNEIPHASKNGVHVKVIAGTSMNITSSILTINPSCFFDFTLEPNASFHQPVPKSWTAFCYILDGAGVFGPNQVPAHQQQTVIFKKDQGTFIEFKNNGLNALRLFLIGAQPLNEPIARRGP